MGTEFSGFFIRKKPENSVPIGLPISLELTAKLYGRYTLYNIYFICQERKEEVTHDFTTINISCDSR